MRKGLFGLTVALTALTAFSLAPAVEEKPKKGLTSNTGKSGDVSMFDANGNPVPLQQNAVTPKASGLRLKPLSVQRGQAWWPYGESQAPYNAVVKRAEAMTEDEIQVNGVALLNVRDVEATLRLVPRDLKLPEGAQLARPDGYFLLKIEGFSRTQEQLDALRNAGAVLGEYLNVNTYIAKIPSGSIAAVKTLPFVTFVGDYHPAYKISPRIGLERIPETEVLDATTGKMKPWLFQVTLHDGADLNQALDGFHSLGIFPEGGDVLSNIVQTVVLVRATPETVLSIAQLPEVKWISEKTFPKLDASNTSPATIPMQLQNNGVFTVNTGTGWKFFNIGLDGNLSGTAQIVTVMDSGLNTKMEHFSEDTAVAGPIGAAHRKVVGYDVQGAGDQCVTAFSDLTSDGGHGTWTSQHAVGSISNMTTNPDVTHVPNNFWDPGIAPDGKVYFQDIGVSGSLFPPNDLGTSITAAIGKGSFIQNHSWSAATNTYEPDAVNLDTALFANPNFVVTVSAGNDGTEGAGSIGHLCTAKNVICVGGVDVASVNSVFQDCLWDGAAPCGQTNDLGSARGPVAAPINRTKPDILGYMANSALVGGEFMAGNRPTAMCQADPTKTVYWDWNNNNGFGGTSFSSPQVAGLAALVRDYFQAGMYPSGTATPADTLTPSGSLVKAVILASGEETSTVASPSNAVGAMLPRYSNDAGYGRANLPGVLKIGGGAPNLWVRNNDTLAQALTKTFTFNIISNSIPLRVMLVWYDQANGTIVRNANLKVTIGANQYLGNVFANSWSTTGGTFDITNTTEGVFLDQAHGLPASGPFTVDVIGANNPGGMNYSLVVSGNVVNTAVLGVSLDKGVYTCAGPINITVTDPLATSPVSVTVTSKDSGSTVIDTEIVSCTGSNGVFNGTVIAGGALTVVHGGSITATYTTVHKDADIACQASLNDEGFLIGGGCDNIAAGTDDATGPLTNGGVNEFYNKYFDANEYSTYTVGFSNQTGAPLTDVYVSVAFSGPGASKMSALNGPIHVGAVPVDQDPLDSDDIAGAVFQLFTDPSAAGVPFPTTVSLDFTFTSPADGYTTPTTFSHTTHQLHSNDIIARQNRCSTFNGPTLAPWVESTLTGGAANPYKWSGTATTPATVSSENRIDGICFNNTANAAAMVGNSAITAANNFAANADSTLLQNFQPALTGNGPNGQPYHYVWKWHSFYSATETLNASTGVWGVFYDNAWNNPVNPTGDQVSGFPIHLGDPTDSGYFYQFVLDYVGSWNWETANTGTPDDPNAATPAPNQFVIPFTNVNGLATPTTYFAYGHEHADLANARFGGTSTAATRRDIAFDNDNLVYDEYYTVQQPAQCAAGSQLGQPAFDQYSYGSCPNGTAVLSVADANAGGSVQVTVSSPGTLDTELVMLSLVGAGPLHTGSVAYSTTSGVGANNGVLFALPNETLTVSYSDSSPVGTSTATAAIDCVDGDVAYVTNTQASDNGDNDGLPDNNECVSMDITIKNNLATPITNTKVSIFSNSPNVDLVTDNHAEYGTVAANTSATNPASDRFSFHVASGVQCTDPANPPTAKFTVAISADGIDGAPVLQTFTISLDQDIGAGTVSYTQNFTVDPGWTTGVTAPDNANCSLNYVNDFHWCALCGNASGGYGAWVGNAALTASNYRSPNSSTLYSPVFVAGGASVTLQFRTGYRTEPLYDGAIVQYQLGAGPWTNLGFTTPTQTATQSADLSCSPILYGASAWTGTGTASAVTTTSSVTTVAGQKLGFRWRLGGDSALSGSTYGGFTVDDVVVGGLRNFICEPTRNPGLVCGYCTFNANGSACDDVNPCTITDVCSTGSCVGTSWPAPDEAQNLKVAGDKVTYSYDALPRNIQTDWVRGVINSLPVGPGSGDETCIADQPGLNLIDGTAPATPGTGWWYLVRGQNACGNGTYGTQGVNGAPGAPRVTTTCP